MVDVNAVRLYNETALHGVLFNGHVDVAKVLIQNGADVNAVNEYKRTVLEAALLYGHVHAALQLVCFGAEIDEKATKYKLLGQVNERLNLLRSGRRIGTSLMSKEEMHFMWNLAFSLTIQNCAVAFKVYYRVHSFITFHGIFMAKGYERGKKNVWTRKLGYLERLKER